MQVIDGDAASTCLTHCYKEQNHVMDLLAKEKAKKKLFGNTFLFIVPPHSPTMLFFLKLVTLCISINVKIIQYINCTCTIFTSKDSQGTEPILVF